MLSGFFLIRIFIKIKHPLRLDPFIMKSIYIPFFILLFPLFFHGQQLTLVTSLHNSLNESSGLIYLNQKLITHNDSGGEPILYEIDSISGEVIRGVYLSNATNVDWEDICFDNTYIYVADIGNNAGSRTDLKIYRLLISDYFMTTNDTVTVDIINYSYADQTNFTPSLYTTNFDAEALISCNDSLYIFTKNWGNYWTNIYALPKTPGTYQTDKADSIYSQGLVTGATYNSSVNTILLSGYTIISTFIVEISDFTPDQFSGGSIIRYQIDPPDGSSKQVESIAFFKQNQYYLTAEESSSGSPSLYRLVSNNNVNIGEPEEINEFIYPNPFTTSTAIEFELDGNSKIQIIIFNSIGGVVHQFEDHLEQGNHSITWSPDHLADGMYYAVIRSEDGVSVVKIVKQ